MIKKTIKKSIRVVLTPFVFFDFLAFKKKDSNPRFGLSLQNFYPQVKDKTIQTSFDRHYVYHTSWAARVVAKTKPKKHIDISSSLYFSGIVSAFVPVEFYDYRPANIHLSNLGSNRGDLLALPFADNSVESISCMHTIEHVGLGRYGDPIDPEGDVKAVKELKRVTAKGGNLLFVVPIGAQAIIEFNAHRIYNYEQVMAMFTDFTLKEFSLIPEREAQGGLVRNATPALLKNERYACGCFWFVK